MNDPAPVRGIENAVESPPASYAGRTRYTQLEYEALLANATLGIAFTRDRRFFLCNPKFAEMFGWGPEELIGRSGEVIYPSAESYAALARLAVPILSSGRQLDIEWEMRRKDGSTFLCRTIAKAIDAANTAHGTVWICEDVTDKRRHADELGRLLREQAAILGTASVGIVFIKERRIVRCNRRYEEMYGYGPGEMEGQPSSILYSTREDEANAARAYENLQQVRPVRRIEQRRRKDGSTFWARIDGRAVDPQDPHKGTVWAVEDITEQRRFEEELQRVLAEQQALLNNVLVGIQFTRERKTVRCNRRFEEMFGYALGAAVGAPTRDSFFTDEEYERVGQDYARLDQGQTHSREAWVRRQDGSGFWCRISGRAVEPGNPAQGYVWLLEDITQQHEAEERVQRALAEQELILDNAAVGIAFVRNRVIQRCNRFLEEMVAAGPGELVGQSSALLFASEEEWREAGRRAFPNTEPGGTYSSEQLFKRHDGSTFLCRTRGRRIDAGDPEQEWIWSYEDVTAEREAEARVQRALAEQELILDNATVGIAFVRNRTYQRCNPRFAGMFGYKAEELAGKSTNVIFPTRRNFDQAAEWYAKLALGEAFSIEHKLKRKDGSVFWCKVVAKAIDPARPDEGSIWIHDDITAERTARDALERAVAERTAELKSANDRLEAEIAERKQAEERARHLADHDALTGLPNRRLLEDRLTQALALSYRNRQQTAVMFIDLDRFKTINDSLGHSIGDVLLKEIAQRLVKQLRIGDTICRIGGDEFVVVLPEVKRSSDVAQVAQKVIETLSLPVAIEERELTVTPSIGISVFPEDGRDAETLIRNADAAMYHAKEMGRANYQFFTEQMNLSAARRLALENDLRRALAKGELRVHYQPIVDAKSGRTSAHEALVRWQHPIRGLIPPAEFIQVAEDTGLILKIGEWMLREACRWGTFIGVERGLPVAVNLSARQFGDPRLVQLVGRALKETGLPPHLLELEITESTAMRETDVTLGTLKKLKELGVSVALDDFGTGYSSFSYLKRFPVNTLKIDRSFVTEIERDGDHRAIVAAIIALAQVLKLKVIAEGVETEAQKKFLQGFGCDHVQGFLTGRPVDPDTAAKDFV
ncbi:MAG TPA: EAL domain-containing protein [Burkholderiales bacterium]|nr:EAL domain-containing protein [Burkholderiales bacterium]